MRCLNGQTVTPHLLQACFATHQELLDNFLPTDWLFLQFNHFCRTQHVQPQLPNLHDVLCVECLQNTAYHACLWSHLLPGLPCADEGEDLPNLPGSYSRTPYNIGSHLRYAKPCGERGGCWPCPGSTDMWTDGSPGVQGACPIVSRITVVNSKYMVKLLSASGCKHMFLVVQKAFDVVNQQWATQFPRLVVCAWSPALHLKNCFPQTSVQEDQITGLGSPAFLTCLHCLQVGFKKHRCCLYIHISVRRNQTHRHLFMFSPLKRQQYLPCCACKCIGHAHVLHHSPFKWYPNDTFTPHPRSQLPTYTMSQIRQFLQSTADTGITPSGKIPSQPPVVSFSPYTIVVLALCLLMTCCVSLCVCLAACFLFSMLPLICLCIWVGSPTAPPIPQLTPWASIPDKTTKTLSVGWMWRAVNVVHTLKVSGLNHHLTYMLVCNPGHRIALNAPLVVSVVVVGSLHVFHQSNCAAECHDVRGKANTVSKLCATALLWYENWCCKWHLLVCTLWLCIRKNDVTISQWCADTLRWFDESDGFTWAFPPMKWIMHVHELCNINVSYKSKSILTVAWMCIPLLCDVFAFQYQMCMLLIEQTSNVVPMALDSDLTTFQSVSVNAVCVCKCCKLEIDVYSWIDIDMFDSRYLCVLLNEHRVIILNNQSLVSLCEFMSSDLDCEKRHLSHSVH